MKIGFLITARLKSSRLKLKILKPLNGYSVIERVIQRSKKIKGCSEIVLCTSKLAQDSILNKIAKENNISFFNGSSEDVLQRLMNAAELHDMDYIIGITADNPLFSIYHADLICKTIKTNNSLDYIYTVGMPIGVNIYGIKTKALKTVCEIKEETDTEIWGYLINRPEIFNIKKIEVDDKYKITKERMTIDEIADYNFFKELYNFFPKKSVIDVLDAFKCLRENPKLLKINNMVQQKDLDENIKSKISNFYLKNKNHILKIKKTIYSS